MKTPPATTPGGRPPDWYPTYWEKSTDGTAWDRVKAAMRRDWAQTRADFHAGGEDLNQDVGDTLKQATGKEPLPPPGTPNEQDAWTIDEAAVRYGFSARKHYGDRYERWSDALEVKLSREWDATQTGRPFAEVRELVLQGWNARQ